MPLVDFKALDPATLSKAEFNQYKVCCAALYAYYNRDSMVYENTRGTSLCPIFHKRPPNLPSQLDCSSFVTWCYWAAGAPDPNENDYSMWMSTQTLWPKGTLVGGADVSENALRPGDACFYGWNVPMVGGMQEHTTLYNGKGKCISQGSDEGPKLIPFRGSGSGNKPFIGARRYKFVQ